VLFGVDTIGDVATGATFDFEAFICAVDRERQNQGLSWFDLAAALWDQSADLNAHRDDHPL
jgi:hypothetical protein